MFKKRRRAFTLIELLAVIVILGLILVITSPVIFKVMEDARRGAFRASAYGIVKSAENNYYKKVLFSKPPKISSFTYENGEEIPLVDNDKLEYKGERPENGEVIINQQGQVAIALHNGTYCALKKYEETYVTVIRKKLEDCKLDLEELEEGVLPEVLNLSNQNLVLWVDMQEEERIISNQHFDNLIENYRNIVNNQDCFNPVSTGNRPSLVNYNGFNWINFDPYKGDFGYSYGHVLPFSSPFMGTIFLVYIDETPESGSFFITDTPVEGGEIEHIERELLLPGYSSPIGNYQMFKGDPSSSDLLMKDYNPGQTMTINQEIVSFEHQKRIRYTPTVISVTNVILNNLGQNGSYYQYDDPYNFFFIGKMAEVIGIEGGISPSQVQEIHHYLMNKYNIS